MDPLSIRSRAGVQSWQVTGSSSWQVTVSSICTLTTLADNERFSEEHSSCRFCWSAFDLRLFWPTSNIYIYIYGRYNDDNDMMTGGTVTLTCRYNDDNDIMTGGTVTLTCIFMSETISKAFEG